MAGGSMEEFEEKTAFAGGHSQVAEHAKDDLQRYYQAMLEYAAEDSEAAASSESPSKKARAE
jgi:hypothetical protein